MRKGVFCVFLVSMLCISLSLPGIFANSISTEDISERNLEIKSTSVIEDKDYYEFDTIEGKGFSNDFGVWIHTNYNGVEDEDKLNIDLSTFTLMLNGGGWKYFDLDLRGGQSTAGIQFSRTKIYLDDGSSVDVFQTQFSFETNIDTSEDYEVSLEVRFPFSILEKAKTRMNFFESFISRLFEFLSGRISEFFEKVFNRLFPGSEGGNGVLASGLCKGADLRTAIKYANVAASIAVTKKGAQSSMPFWHEIKKKYNELYE